MAVEPKFGARYCLKYVRLPWKGQISVQFERKTKSAVSSCFRAADLRVIQCTKPLLSHTHKDVLPSSSLSNVIYKFTCLCDVVFVGRTLQRLEDLVKQHVPKCLLTHLEQQSSLSVFILMASNICALFKFCSTNRIIFLVFLFSKRYLSIFVT